MQNTEELQLFAVAGNPISHSLSPQMMNSAMKFHGFNGYYMRLAADSAEEIIAVMKFFDMSGCNITAPFKTAIFDVLDFYDVRVQQTACANLVHYKDQRLFGYNTDVNGVFQSLTEYGDDFQALSVLIIGYGGAARAAAYACRMMQMQEYVTGKDMHKIERFAEQTGCIPVAPDNIQQAVDNADVIISTIPKETLLLNQVTFEEQQIVLDCSYSNLNLKNKVTSRNAFYISGKKWLLYQGCPAYKIFTDLEAPIEEMYAAILQEEPEHPTIFSIIAVFDGVLQTAGAHLSGFEECNLIDLTEELLSVRKIRKKIRKTGEKFITIVMSTTEQLHNKDFCDFIKNETFCFFLVNFKEKEKTLQHIRVTDVLLSVEGKTGAQVAARIRKEIENVR